MSAYVIGRLNVTNWDWYREYRSVTEPLVAEHGGRYLVKGGESELLEGDTASPDAVVLIEFPDLRSARAWYHDPRYMPMIDLRRRSGVGTELMIADGCPPSA
jgi:uncharacterized protein (DUF1330 family)